MLTGVGGGACSEVASMSIARPTCDSSHAEGAKIAKALFSLPAVARYSPTHMLDLHRELLADEVRTNAYREAIRRFVTPESVVLDLGSGSGILALFASEAGARRVFAVEQQSSAGIAAFLARHLKFGERIEVIRERSTNVHLPEPADLLVTETIAMFGLQERILSSVLDARSRL